MGGNHINTVQHRINAVITEGNWGWTYFRLDTQRTKPSNDWKGERQTSGQDVGSRKKGFPTRSCWQS